MIDLSIQNGGFCPYIELSIQNNEFSKDLANDNDFKHLKWRFLKNFQAFKMADLSDHSARRKCIASANRWFILSSWLGILSMIFSFYSNPSSSKNIPKLF